MLKNKFEKQKIWLCNYFCIIDEYRGGDDSLSMFISIRSYWLSLKFLLSSRLNSIEGAVGTIDWWNEWT